MKAPKRPHPLVGTKIYFLGAADASLRLPMIMPELYASYNAAASMARRTYGPSWRDTVNVSWRRVIA